MTPYDRARGEIGTFEWKEGHNPKVLKYFADTGNAWVKDDETAWCAAFVGAMLERSHIKSTRKLNARSYLDWGTPVTKEQARPGDIVVFYRGDPKGWQGHVAFLVKFSGNNAIVLGGNQANQVNESKYPVSSILGIRRAPSFVQPDVEPVPPAAPKSKAAPAVAAGGGALALGAAYLWATACQWPWFAWLFNSCGG